MPVDYDFSADGALTEITRPGPKVDTYQHAFAVVGGGGGGGGSTRPTSGFLYPRGDN